MKYKFLLITLLLWLAACTPDWWGEPIDAPERTWYWVNFPNSECANGTPTGIGVNLVDGANLVFIHIMGGGACWDYEGCFEGSTLPVVNLDGFDQDKFNRQINSLVPILMTDRSDLKNPFTDAHWVFIPYCTGDLHAGDSVTEIQDSHESQRGTMHFKGYRNMQEFLTRLVPTFKNVEKVVLSGISAGGYGSHFNWHQVQQAFGDIRVDVLNDSGTPVNPDAQRWKQWATLWNIQFPQDCLDCLEGIDRFTEYYRGNLLATNRYGLISWTPDELIAHYFNISPEDFEVRLHDVMEVFDQEKNAHYFVVSGSGHGFLFPGYYENIESDDGMYLWRWVEQLVDDDPGWTSFKP